MANPAPIGSDVSAGTYRCTNCGSEIQVQSVQSLPPCPSCDGPNEWEPSAAATAARIRTRTAASRVVRSG